MLVHDIFISPWIETIEFVNLCTNYSTQNRAVDKKCLNKLKKIEFINKIMEKKDLINEAKKLIATGNSEKAIKASLTTSTSRSWWQIPRLNPYIHTLRLRLWHGNKRICRSRGVFTRFVRTLPDGHISSKWQGFSLKR